MKYENRYLESGPITADEKNNRKLSGYAVVWNTRSSDLGGFVEQFAPYAFRQYLGTPQADVRAFVGHDPNKIIARQSAGTLSLQEDDHGLRFSMDVANTSYGDDILESVRRGDITGMSFNFKPTKDGSSYRTLPDGVYLRTVSNAIIGEISPVSLPAYDSSAVFNRCSDEALEELRQLKESEKRNLEIDLATYTRQIEALRYGAK